MPEKTCEYHETEISAPVGLRVETNPEENEVVLSWGHWGEDVSGFNVYRKVKGEDSYSKINESPVLNVAFKDNQAYLGKTYKYKITALASSGAESFPLIGSVEVGKENGSQEETEDFQE